MSTFETSTTFTCIDSNLIADGKPLSNYVLRQWYLNQNFIYGAITGRNLSGTSFGGTKHPHTGSLASAGAPVKGVVLTCLPLMDSSYNARVLLQKTTSSSTFALDSSFTSPLAKIFLPTGINRLRAHAYCKVNTNTGTPQIRFTDGSNTVDKTITNTSYQWIDITSASQLTVTENSTENIDFQFAQGDNTNSITLSIAGYIIYYETTTV